MRASIATLLAASLAAACTGVIEGGAPGTVDPGADGGSTDEPGADAASPLRDDGTPAGSWRDRAGALIDSEALAAAFAAEGYQPPPGVILYGGRIEPGADLPSYTLFDYGPGAFSKDFWPASTIKLISAIGAADFLHAQGFTGAAQVSFAGVGNLGSLRDVYGPAIRVSDNLAYTRTLQLAGVERINQVFLTAERGFADTVLTRSYVQGVTAWVTPEITISEGGETLVIPARTDPSEYGCVGNCTNLYDLFEGLRRIVLDAEIPAAQRYDLDPADVAELHDALCDAPSYMEAGAERALGPVRICNKTGNVPSPDYHYLDHGVIEVEATGERYFLAVVVPWQVACGTDADCRALISELAEHALPALRDLPGAPVQDEDGGVAITVQRDSDTELTVDAPGADALDVWIDRSLVGSFEGSGRFAVTLPGSPGTSVVTVRARAGDIVVGHRALEIL